MASLFNLAFFFSLLNVAHGFRALMMASNVGYSHLQYTGQLADILVNAGHEVDYLLEVWHRAMKHNGTKKANVIRFEGKNVEKIETALNKMAIWGDAFEGEFTMEQMIEFGKVSVLHCESLLTDYKLLDYLRSRNYTVGLAENFDSCAWGVFRLLNIKSIHELNAIPLSENSHFVHGFGFDFRRVPVFYNTQQIGPVKTMLEVIQNAYHYFNARYTVTSGQFGPTNQLFKDLIDPNHPTIAELQKESAYVWVNTHEFADFARANSAKVKHIGGIAVKKPEELNKETTKIFEKAKKGVVLVSFGSIVDTTHMKPEIRDSMLQAFSRFPEFEFIWRLTKVDDNITAIFNQYPNVHPFSWLQQTAILNHPKTRGFISHMGLNSFNEAVHYGVPIVAIPFFGDQQLNTAIALKQGVAVYLYRRAITIDSMANALSKILHNDKYRERALNLKAKIVHSPVNQTEMFVKYVEFAEKFGALEELQLDTAGASLVELFHLDLIGLALLALFIAYKLTLFMSRRMLQFLNTAGHQLTQVSRPKKVD